MLIRDACKIHEVGKSKLHMHDATIRCLIDVQYAPNLKKNIGSIRTLESKGFKTIMVGKVINIVATLIVMKGTQLVQINY